MQGLSLMAFNFKVPDSFKRRDGAAPGSFNSPSSSSNPPRRHQRETLSYADLDDPNGAPERRRNVFALRRGPDGSLVAPPTEARPRLSNVTRPTLASKAPGVFSKNPFSLKRTTAVVKKAKQVVRRSTSESNNADDSEQNQALKQEHPAALPGTGLMRTIENRKELPLRREALPLVAANPPLPPSLHSQLPTQARTIAPINTGSLRTRAEVLRSLRALHGRHCPVDFDRYQLLDERDKLMCRLRELEGGVRSKKEATCPDMCPEKERYVRVVQKRLSAFECDERGVMQPRKTVKEYARSAADQEEPLAHELRPGRQLVVTMEYLLTQIADAMPAVHEAAAWYDFLWSRTRAIRKELTQQMLSDTTAVSLVEVCTRFHIFVGYALCTLDVAEFDQRMNTENMGKSLQTLRHLYEDLEKKGIFCDSESEFRAYDVMLHMNDSNILRQVLKYRQVVRESPAVCLALRLVSAVQTNNFVRFFRLLRQEATFMQCAIVHRFFLQVRSGAWTTMCAAYQRGALFPVQIACKNLGYNDAEELIKAAREVGIITADGDPSLLQLNRDFLEVNMESPPTSVTWIDLKRQGISNSELLRGGLPRQRHSSPSAIRDPIDSFDSSGRYTKDPVLAECLGKDAIGHASNVNEQENVPSTSAFIPPAQVKPGAFSFVKPPGQSAVAGSFVVFAGRPLFPSGAVSAAHKDDSAAKNALLEEELKRQAEKKRLDEEKVNCITGALIDGIADEYLLAVAKECLLAERLEAKQQRANAERERQLQLQRDAERRKQEEAALLAAKRIEEEEKRRALVVKAKSVSNRLTERVWKDFLHTVDDLTFSAVEYSISSYVDVVRSGLETFSERLHLLWLRQFYERWRTFTFERRRIRQVLGELAVRSANSVSPIEVKSRKRSLTRSEGDDDSDAHDGAASSPKQPRRSLDGLGNALPLEKQIRAITLMERRRTRLASEAFEWWRVWTRMRIQRRQLIEPFLDAEGSGSRRLSIGKAWLPALSEIRQERRHFRFDKPTLHLSEVEESFNPLKDDSERDFKRCSGYSFLAPEDSFLEYLAATQRREECETSLSNHTEGWSTLAENSAITQHDMDYALSEQTRCGWQPSATPGKRLIKRQKQRRSDPVLATTRDISPKIIMTEKPSWSMLEPLFSSKALRNTTVLSSPPRVHDNCSAFPVELECLKKNSPPSKEVAQLSQEMSALREGSAKLREETNSLLQKYSAYL